VGEPVSDHQLQLALGRFAAVAEVLLRDPGAWLGHDAPRPARQDRPEGAGRRLLAGVGAVAGTAGRVVRGREYPGSPGWAALPVARRSAWWVTRIQTVAAPIAATPRIAGALADRLPVQGTLGTAVAGLTVCAVAREHGVRDPQDWVPLLGAVLFDRELARPATAPSADAAAAAADEGAPDLAKVPLAAAAARGPLRRLVHGLWRLALLLLGLPGIFDQRPRGGFLWRWIGKLPLVGLPAGLLDERGAVRAAADRTRRLLQERAVAASPPEPSVRG